MKPGKLMVASLFLMSLGGLLVAQEKSQKPGDRDRDRRERTKHEESSKEDRALKAGDLAPTFTLKSLDGKKETDLAGFRGQRPVVLFFGSYT